MSNEIIPAPATAPTKEQAIEAINNVLADLQRMEIERQNTINQLHIDGLRALDEAFAKASLRS
jgi:hypothetical protein